MANKTGQVQGEPGSLLDLQEALSLTRAQVKNLHKKYLNASLATMMELLNFDRQYVRARGISVWDSQGREYLDFLGGYGALNLGHNHPKILAALQRVQEMPNILQASLGTVAAALAHNLARITPGRLQRSFFCNSGAEAVEGAIKLARAATGRSTIIYCQGSFHGKTMGALSVTGREKYQKPFTPLVPHCQAVPYGDLHSLEKALQAREAAAFIVEPIQGEGGIILPPPGYLKKARELCRRYGTLFIADEVQTGFGRTGYMFACEAEEVEPDIMCLAKSLGGGVMPMGAYITTDEIWQRAYGGMEKALLHTSTFGGNTMACTAALAAIQVIYEENLVEQAREIGDYFLTRLKELQTRFPLLKEVRGRGLMIGLEFNQPGRLASKVTFGLAGKLAEEYTGSLVAGELLNNHGIITAYTLNNPNVIRLEPPLCVTREHVDRVVAALEDIFQRHRGFISMATAGAKTILKSLTQRE
ncbi:MULTISPECIES: aspartate aminotransferase family protein [Desulfofundulus]|jgi:putrescine aminotransferase|uniref:Putrescine aminotransferase n=1 Tax=Desulfofundulus australicus DSM 11792 TaxID=1121425 RepID=A0A1M5CEP6_9FIRM|nr:MULTISPECIES: aspartate aminotransferase family protein [Desulfofundulus]MBE3586492.1 aspartate aminotransferase family protein [Thermoanaerobacter sp.]MCS5697220.1 aspartate aminotransferase family protein [Desulfofundulus thermocisternus]SHF53218.1 putrescine aminotransferase [Desulfofundulus australicus DSM 11792]